MIELVAREFSKSIIVYEDVLNYIEIYVKEVSRAIISTNPIKYNEVLADIASTRDRNKLPPTDIDQLDFANKVYENIEFVETQLKKLAKLFKNKIYMDYRNARLSFNTIIREDEKRQAILDKLAAEIASQNDSAIFAMVEKEPIPKLVTFIMQNREVNRLTIFTAGLIIRNGSPKNVEVIRDILETHKNAMLSASRMQIDDPMILARYNLIPAGHYNVVGADKIAQVIGGILSAKKINLIVLTKQSTHPLDFNLDGLISQEYIKKNKLFGAGDKGGLNDKFLIKTATIRELNSSDNVDVAQTTSFDIKKHEIDAKYKWLVMEVMRGGYRFMTKLLQVGEQKHIFNYGVSANDIRGVLNGLSGRPSAYASLCEQGPFIENDNSRVIDDNAIHVIDAYDSRVEIKRSTDPIKRKIISGVMAHVSAMKIKTAREFQYLKLSDASIMRLFQESMPAQIAKHANYRELFTTYYAKLYSIVNEFTKRFRRELHIANVSDDDFDDDAKLAKIIIENIVIKILEEMDVLRLFANFTVSLKEAFLVQ